MVELNKLTSIGNGAYYVKIKVDRSLDLGDVSRFIWVMRNRQNSGMKPLIFKLCAKDNNILAYHLEFKDDLLFSFRSSSVYEQTTKEEYLAYVDEVDVQDENAPILDLVMFPMPEEYKHAKKEEEDSNNKLLDELGQVNLYDESAPPIWVCYNYGAERKHRECSIYRGKGSISCEIEDIEQQSNYKQIYSQISEGDNVVLKEDGEYTIGVYWNNKKIGNVEARNVPAVALCISNEGGETKISQKWEDEYRMYICVPATFIRLDEPELNKKYGPFSFEVKIVKRSPSWQEFRFEVPQDKFKHIFYYEDPRAKKYSKEELEAQPLPDLSELECREDIETFAVDFLKYIRSLGNIKTVEVNYYPYKKSASIDFNDSDENFSFEDHQEEIENYLGSCGADFMSYKFEYCGIAVKFKL